MEADISGVIPPGPAMLTRLELPAGGVRASKDGFGTLPAASCEVPWNAEK